jgi:hypothetical protein
LGQTDSFFDLPQLFTLPRTDSKLKITQLHSQHYLKMIFTNRSNLNELSTPLLGKRPQHESDEEQGCILDPSVTLAIVYDDEEKESCRKAAQDESQWRKPFIDMVVLPALLFLQFGMAFFMSPVEATTGLQLSVVNYSIVIFVVNAALYRQTVQDFQIACLVARLLPEIIIGTVMGLVFCCQIVPAFLLLMSSMLCMALFVVVSSMYYLAILNSHTSLEEEYDEESIHDVYGVGFEPLFTM